jgi:hypothetical protein
MMVANTTSSSGDRSEELRKAAENLATIAVQDRIAATQIRGLYDKIRTRGIDDFRVYLKYQMGRNDSKYKVIISRRFGDTLLSYTDMYQKLDLVTLLKYTVMLYDYTHQTMISSRPGMSTSSPSPTSSSNDRSTRISEIKRTEEITGEVRGKIEQVVKAKTSQFGFMRTDLEPSYDYGGRRKLKINVRLSNFRGDPRELSLQLASVLSSEIHELSGTQFHVWIERGLRF